MDRQEMLQFAQRIAHARDNDARMQEIVGLAPESFLSRLGLTHRTSFASNVLSTTGIFVIGAAVGAGVALLLAPTTGEEMRADLRRQAKRLSRETKQAAATATVEAQERIESVRNEVADLTGGEPSQNGKRATAHA